MAIFKEQQQVIAKLREQREESDRKLYFSQIDLFRNGKDGARRAAVEGNRKAMAVSISSVQETIGGLYVDPHPRSQLGELDDGIPFLLLPVRIETRFITGGSGSELWLRIYPDDIAVHTHEKVLTGEEVGEGTAYWKALFNAIKTGGQVGEEKKKAAWNRMASLFGGSRAAWVAVQTKPANWAGVPGSINSDSDLVFPVQAQTKPDAWSRAPRTKVMPDKFVVLLYGAGMSGPQEIVGPVLPDELVLGPDPMEPEASFATADGSLRFGQAFDWTMDMDRAVQAGMAFKIPLTAEQASAGFERIVVLGLSLSSDEMTCKALLEELIDNHHYSPKGFSIVLQGTPTNNTEQGSTGYTKNDPLSAISYDVETGAPAFTEEDDCDGRNLADALGIEYGPLQYVLNSGAAEYRQAVAMNTALYPATLGFFLGTMLSPVFEGAEQDAIRRFAAEHVTGMGPFPAIRVGNQPYGILLTSDMSRWGYPAGQSFLQKTQSVLMHYQGIWDQAAADLIYAGKPGTDPSDALVNILGLQAGSVSFAQRSGYSTDYLKNLDDFQYGGKYWPDMVTGFNQKNNLLNFLSGLGYAVTDGSGHLRVPQALRLVYQHFTTMLDAANLVEGPPLSEKDAVRYFDQDTGKNYLDWLAEASTVEALEQQDFGSGRPAPTALLYLLLRRALLLEMHRASVKWFASHGVDLGDMLSPANFLNIRPSGDLTRYEVMKATVGTADPANPRSGMSVAEYLLQLGGAVDEAGFLSSMRSALKILAATPAARLERLLTDHLDACTYRLDAWQTGLFRSRLLEQRGLPAGAQRERRKGIYLGAFGWVEHVHPALRTVLSPDSVPEPLRPAGGQPVFDYPGNGGFVHAPSLDHAAAAAVMRSGYLSHTDSSRREMMAVNLSSERVRRGLFVLEGIRNGQSLEALLGYQFERGLHDRASAGTALSKLNLYIYELRDAFPILQHQIPQQGSQGSVTESLPASNVVNGVTLAESNLLFPYGAVGEIAAATPAEQIALEQERGRLADTLDAVKDMLLSESVYQMVRGNADRSAAVMNALRDAHIPPELEVINTPRGSRFTFTNRITIQFDHLDPDQPSSNPWQPSPMSPRARMEPGLNSWLGKVLGRPEDILCRAARLDEGGNEISSRVMTVQDLLLQPIDLVYIVGSALNTGAEEEGREDRTGASELEVRIARRFKELSGLSNDAAVRIEFLKPETTDHKTLGQMLSLVGKLKGLVTDARPLEAEDFDPPSRLGPAIGGNPQGYDDSELALRVQSVLGSLGSLLSEMGAIPIDATVTDSSHMPHACTTLQETFAAMDAYSVSAGNISFTLAAADAMHLVDVLMRIADFGVASAYPGLITAASAREQAALLDLARSAARGAARSREQAAGLAVEGAASVEVSQKIAKYAAAGKAIFGDMFNILPLFTYNNETDIQHSNADRGQLLAYVAGTVKMRFPADEWLQQVSHVRARSGRWDSIRLLTESFENVVLEMKPVQLPYRPGDSWLAVEFPETSQVTDPATGAVTQEPFTITQDTLSVAIHGDAAFAAGAKQSGLLVDEWIEMIPTREEITGITFNYDQPDARPPQALLLVVTPQVSGSWRWDDLVGAVNDSLQRAKRRAVEPLMLDKVNKDEVGVLLPAVVADFSQVDLNVALDYRVNLKDVPPVKSVASLQPG